MIKLKRTVIAISLLAFNLIYAVEEHKDFNQVYSLDDAEMPQAQNQYPAFKLISKDGNTFNVPYNIAMQSNLIKTTFSYETTPNTASASLSFHLTAAEKKGIANSLNNEANQKTFQVIKDFSSGKF